MVMSVFPKNKTKEIMKGKILKFFDNYNLVMYSLLFNPFRVEFTHRFLCPSGASDHQQ